MAQVVDSTAALSLAARIALEAAAVSSRRAAMRLRGSIHTPRGAALSTRQSFKEATKLLRDAMVSL